MEWTERPAPVRGFGSKNNLTATFEERLTIPPIAKNQLCILRNNPIAPIWGIAILVRTCNNHFDSSNSHNPGNQDHITGPAIVSFQRASKSGLIRCAFFFEQERK
jgi:hypothetical protein